MVLLSGTNREPGRFARKLVTLSGKTTTLDAILLPGRVTPWETIMVSIRGRSVAVVVISLVLGALGPVAGAVTEGDRAMWVWGAPEAAVVDFAVAKGVNTIYLHAPPGFSSDTAHASFLLDAHDEGLQVYAMAGDPVWAKKPAPMYRWVAEVVDHGGFDGVIVDVEPYLHSDWASSRSQSRLIDKYLRGLDRARALTGSLPFVAAVPFWFDDAAYDRNGEPLVGAVLDRVDGIVVMAYRDHADGADGIIEHASGEVALAASKGKSAVVGVETGQTGLDKTTFAEEGEGAMEAALVATAAALGASTGFGGVSIHHYGSWTTLSP